MDTLATMKLHNGTGRTAFQYMPYGKLHAAHEEEIANPRIPERWLEARSATQYRAWLDVVHQQIRDGLWPTWDVQQQRWDGAASAFMDELTEWDLRIMAGLGKWLQDPVAPTPGAPRHLEFFAWEDWRGGRAGDGLAAYHALLDPATTQYDPREIFVTGLQGLCGSTALLLKVRLQRPRAYHVGFRKNGAHATPRQFAQTADTPSMISGHCLEGALAGAWTARRHFMWVRQVADQWAAVKPRLQQWVMDIGDRRVMAQVHYPSDNIGSWWTVLTQLQQMRDGGGRGAQWLYDFLREALPVSHVYQAIRAEPPPASVTLWRRLQALVEERR